jgi:hypothetical protein
VGEEGSMLKGRKSPLPKMIGGTGDSTVCL